MKVRSLGPFGLSGVENNETGVDGRN